MRLRRKPEIPPFRDDWDERMARMNPWLQVAAYCMYQGLSAGPALAIAADVQVAMGGVLIESELKRHNAAIALRNWVDELIAEAKDRGGLYAVQPLAHEQ